MASQARWKEEPFTVRLVTNAGGKVDVELDWLVEQSSLSPFSVIVHRQSPGCGEKGRREELAPGQREDSCLVGVLESILDTVCSTGCTLYSKQ